MNATDFYMAKTLNSGGGGTGSLPTPSADNVGKSLTVIETPVDGEVIVPEQTGTLDAVVEFECENAVKSLFTEGTQFIAYVDGVRYEGTITANGDELYADIDDTQETGFCVLGEDSALTFYDATKEVGTEVTVKLCVKGDTEYGYAFDEYAGYDFVVQNTASPRPNYDDSTDAFSIIKGSIEECENKILAGKIVRGLLVYSFVNADHQPIESVMELCFFDGSYREIWFYTKYTSGGGVCMIVFEYDSDYAIYSYRYMHDDSINEA